MKLKNLLNDYKKHLVIFGLFCIVASAMTYADWVRPNNRIFYGGMYYHNHTGTLLNFAVQNQYYPVFFTDAPHLSGFTFNGGWGVPSNITAQYAGTYQVTYMASGDGQNNHRYATVVFINDTEQEQCENYHKMAAGGDIITQSGNCFIEVSVTDRITLRVADYTGTGTGKYYSGNINLLRVSD